MQTMMHLTCTNMRVEKLAASLAEARASGVRNLLALRGDPPQGQATFTAVEGGFGCALDLIRYIRAEHGDWFGICVSGYPEAHPDVIVEDPVAMAAAYAADVAYLKAKVDAGADFIITQLFYDVDRFIAWVRDVRAAGVTVPILPGVMPITSYGGFKRMTAFCKTAVPVHISRTLEAIKDNDAAVRAYGASLATLMCQRLLDAGVPGIHLYTLNQEATPVAVLENLSMILHRDHTHADAPKQNGVAKPAPPAPALQAA